MTWIMYAIVIKHFTLTQELVTLMQHWFVQLIMLVVLVADTPEQTYW